MSARGHIVYTVNSTTVERISSWERWNVRRSGLVLVLFLANFPALVLASQAFLGRASSEAGGKEALVYAEVVNVDGDVSLSEGQNKICWNPHSTGLTAESAWTVSFENEVRVFLKTGAREAGHVAVGAWWSTIFSQFY